MTTVLVTGGSGFLASHCIIKLLRAGYTVRTTVRNERKAAYAREMFKNAGVENQSRLSFVIASLESNTGWEEAVKGCTYVLHVASPFPSKRPADKNEVITPTVDGAIRVLMAARNSGTVKRVVLTSSIAAVGYGNFTHLRAFTEKHWSSTQSNSQPLPPIHVAKVLEEKAAWKFIQEDGNGLELTVICPGTIFGPPLGKKLSPSLWIASSVVEGEMKRYPKLWLAGVDVRDLADLQLEAMTNEKAKDERFLAVAGKTSSTGSLMKAAAAKFGGKLKVPKSSIPNFLFRFMSISNSSIQIAALELEKKEFSNSKACTELGWEPRPLTESFVDSIAGILKLEGRA